MKTATSFFALVLLSMAPGAQAADGGGVLPPGRGGDRAGGDERGRSLVEEHDYDVFGQEVGAQAGTQPKRFAGKERDGETGWDYFGARYYGSKVGRFTTTDPVYTWKENLVDPQRWNRYAYARNNPLRYVDPDGRKIVLQGSDEFKVAYQTAKASLGNHTSLVADLESRTETVILRESSSFKGDSNYFDPQAGEIGAKGAIYWNPKAGLVTTNGGKQSPALGLLHETDHALRWLTDPVAYNRESEKDGSPYRSQEEKRVIRGSEAAVARARGESERTDHGGHSVKVESVTDLPKDK